MKTKDWLEMNKGVAVSTFLDSGVSNATFHINPNKMSCSM
jgi:hypothetical protein